MTDINEPLDPDEAFLDRLREQSPDDGDTFAVDAELLASNDDEAPPPEMEVIGLVDEAPVAFDEVLAVEAEPEPEPTPEPVHVAGAPTLPAGFDDALAAAKAAEPTLGISPADLRHQARLATEGAASE